MGCSESCSWEEFESSQDGDQNCRKRGLSMSSGDSETRGFQGSPTESRPSVLQEKKIQSLLCSPRGIGSRTPGDTKNHRCSIPLQSVLPLYPSADGEPVCIAACSPSSALPEGRKHPHPYTSTQRFSTHSKEGPFVL